MYQGKSVQMVCYQDLLDHLVQAKVFTAKHSSGQHRAPDADILACLKGVDEAIRGMWSASFRANDPVDIPFANCVSVHKPTAASLWIAAPALRRGPAAPLALTDGGRRSQGGDGGGGGGRRGGCQDQGDGGGGSRNGGNRNGQGGGGRQGGSGRQAGGGRQGGGDRQGGGGRDEDTAPPTGQLAIEDIDRGKGGKAKGKGTKVKTATHDKWGTEICKGYNDKRGCPDPWNCAKANVCDVLMANGQACGSHNHNRVGHTGPKLYF